MRASCARREKGANNRHRRIYGRICVENSKFPTGRVIPHDSGWLGGSEAGLAAGNGMGSHMKPRYLRKVLARIE